MLLILSFDGNPVSKQSFRFAKRGNYVIKYQSAEIIKEEKSIAVQAKEQIQLRYPEFKTVMRSDLMGLEMSYYFYVSAPSNLSKKKKELIKTEKQYCGKRPDTGNYVKLLEDALEGVLYEDDSLIVSTVAKKIYSLRPRTILTCTTTPLIKI